MFGNNCNHHSTLNFVCSLLLLLSSPCNSSILNTKLDADHTTCAIYPLSIHVNKDEFDLAGNLIRNCEDNITVNKCEGTCVSSLQPSVVNPSGFLKKCVCCRENRMKTRKIHLNHCYDPDGRRLTDEQASTTIIIKEPEGCDCFKCG